MNLGPLWLSSVPDAFCGFPVPSREQEVLLVNPSLGDKLLWGATDQLLEGYVAPEEGRLQPVTWEGATEEEQCLGVRLRLRFGKVRPRHGQGGGAGRPLTAALPQPPLLPQPVKQVTWHGKGDYFATVVSDNSHLQVLIHQASKRWSQAPFRRSKGQVQRVLFHPLRPFFFVATQRFVRIYHLLKQELTKKLLTNCKWVSSMAVHPGGERGPWGHSGGCSGLPPPSWARAERPPRPPGPALAQTEGGSLSPCAPTALLSSGDNLICGSYDSRLVWFDLDLSTKPYRVLR